MATSLETRMPAALAAVALAGLLLVGCDKHDQERQGEIRPVRDMVAHGEQLSEVSPQVGEIRSHSETDLGFKIAGKLLERPVDLGTVVKKGDVLARLDEQDQRNESNAAQADLVSVRAMLVQTEAEERRQAQLRAAGWGTQARYEAAVQARDTARAAVRAAEAKQRLAADRQGYNVLRAQENGVITAVGAEAGQVVAAGQMVARLARLDQKDAVFTVAEASLLRIPRDAEVEVGVLDAPGVVAHGRVEQVSPSADPVTRTYTVKVALSDAPAAMRLGMTVVGRLRSTGPRVFVLPASALTQSGGQPAVWVVDPAQSEVRLVKVGLLRAETDRALVTSGLEDGAVVVVAGVRQLWPGRKVRVAGADRPGASASGASASGGAQP